MTVYKADQKTNIYYIIGFVILFGAIVPISSRLTNISLTLLITILFIFVAFNVFTWRLIELQLDKTNNYLILVYQKYSGAKKTLKYELGNIEFTYKRQATSIRGGVKSVCTIYSNNKKVIELVPNNDDWSDHEIKRFVYGLLGQGIKKKSIGYSLKEVKI